MRSCSARYLAAWDDKNAYAVSHVGFGLNPKARYEALAMYDQRDTNGTEIRAVAGNFLFSTGANEFAGRYTAGHFDLPVMRTTITVDGTVVVKDGVVQDLRVPPMRAKRCSAERTVLPSKRASLRCARDEVTTAAGSARSARAVRRTPSAARAGTPRHRALRS